MSNTFCDNSKVSSAVNGFGLFINSALVPYTWISIKISRTSLSLPVERKTQQLKIFSMETNILI